MKILYIGSKDTHEQYVRGIVPSHWLYGAVEMERDGHEVVWEQERGELLHDWGLIRRYHPDLVFVPNLNLHNHLCLLALAALGICKVPVMAWLHHEPKVKTGLKAWFYRLLLSGCKHIFFLSEKTMEETITHGLAKRCCCSEPGWGPDMVFYDKVKTTEGDCFVSTGKENRDFDILIEAFQQTKAQLVIMTAKTHGGSNHEWLQERCKEIPNIKVIITDNTGDVYPQMLQEMARAKALVCPLRKDKLNYCVGLSTIADAEGLGKPLIITRNPYHRGQRTENFNTVDSLEEWVEAIKNIKKPHPSPLSMKQCWEKMKPLFNVM